MIDGMRQHHRQLAQRPATLFMPLVERLLHLRQVALAGGLLVDHLLCDQGCCHVLGGDEGKGGYPI